MIVSVPVQKNFQLEADCQERSVAVVSVLALDW